MGLFDLFSDFLSATNNVIKKIRRYGLEVENEGHLKDLVVIFVFLKLLCTVPYLF
jgi:hypothetical protein